MNHVDKGTVAGLEPDKVTVGARFAPEPPIGFRAFAETERYRQTEFFDFTDNAGDENGVETEIFPSLNHDRSVTEIRRQPRPFQNPFRRQPVAFDIGPGRPNSAIEAVSAADVGDFHKSAQMYRLADMLPAEKIGLAEKDFQLLRIFLAEPRDDFIFS